MAPRRERPTRRLLRSILPLTAAAAMAGLLTSCGRTFTPGPPDATLRPVIERALERAVQDSALYAAASFTLPASMHVSMRQGDEKVSIVDSFLVTKKAGGDPATTVVDMVVKGDSSILLEMYSLKAPGAKKLTFEETQLERLNIAADFRKMLRTMLDGKKMAVRLLDDAAAVGGRQCHLVAFESDDGEGKMALAHGSAELVRIEVQQNEDYLISGFDYAMSGDYHRRSGEPMLPAALRSKFAYRRPFSNGSGTIVVVFDTASAPVALAR